MKLVNFITLMLLVNILLLYRVGGDQKGPDGATLSSMVRVLAYPERYHNTRVALIGYYASGFEYSGLFLTKEDAEVGNFGHGIWIELGDTEDSKSRASKIRNGYVWVVGTLYHRENGGVGHLNAWPAGLRDIKEFLPRERKPIEDDVQK